MIGRHHLVLVQIRLDVLETRVKLVVILGDLLKTLHSLVKVQCGEYLVR